MKDSDLKTPPRVRPRVLLWTLLFCNFAGMIFCIFVAWDMEREASAIVAREPEVRTKADQSKQRIQSESDVEKLRLQALKSIDSRFEEWRDVGYRYHHMSGAFLWAALGGATMSIVLGYALYGLRVERREANKALHATASAPGS